MVFWRRSCTGSTKKDLHERVPIHYGVKANGAEPAVEEPKYIDVPFFKEQIPVNKCKYERGDHEPHKRIMYQREEGSGKHNYLPVR